MSNKSYMYIGPMVICSEPNSDVGKFDIGDLVEEQLVEVNNITDDSAYFVWISNINGFGLRSEDLNSEEDDGNILILENYSINSLNKDFEKLKADALGLEKLCDFKLEFEKEIEIIQKHYKKSAIVVGMVNYWM